jgi:hypothetical protein
MLGFSQRCNFGSQSPRQWRCIAGQGAPTSQKECVAFSYESYSVRKATCSRIHLLSPTWHCIRPYNPIILCTKWSLCHLLVPHTLLLYKLSTYRFSDGYVSWWRSRVPGLGSQILMTFGTWRWWGCQPHAPDAFTPRKCSWYSFSLGAESTPRPWYGRKEICHWKIQWHHHVVGSTYLATQRHITQDWNSRTKTVTAPTTLSCRSNVYLTAARQRPFITCLTYMQFVLKRNAHRLIM